MQTINKSQITGCVLSFLLLVTLINSAYFFLSILRLNIGQWLAFNACSVASIVYLISFVLFQFIKKESLLAFALLPLYYYGTMGLFVMPWNSANAFAQITHIVITINIVWILISLLKGKKFEAIGKGLLAGTMVFVPIFAYIQSYTQLHMNEFLQILQKI
jgi:hypothetical protein